ncbi:MAG: TRAP transporter small permease [Treponema sp.]|nr:TRAP transporter small permease [Treponema sp.]MDD7450238.1 TRAP transporter small permease [Treponema sp.]MDY2924883.1 TRAP transporter small permease [Treponema sp.]MDY5682751.1 TRAP transporter small permease [Treponema sp.]
MTDLIFQKDMNIFEKIFSCITFLFDIIYRILLTYAKVVLLVIIVIVSAQVFSRKFIGSSIRWSEEVALLLMVWLAFIAMAIGVEKKLHIAIEMFVKPLPKPVQKIIEKINDTATMLFGIILVIYGKELVAHTMSSTLPATQWPAGIAYLMMPIGGVFITYFSFLSLFNLEKYRHIEIEEGKAETSLEA